MHSFELVKACIPTREEKQRVARMLGLGSRNSESILYKWCEDPDGSGRANPIDYMDALLDHARLHHPDAAAAIVQHFQAGNVRALTAGAGLTPVHLMLCGIQPGVEKEAFESVSALSAAFRQIVASGSCDLPAVVKEIEELERQAHAAAVVLRAAVAAEQAKTAAVSAAETP